MKKIYKYSFALIILFSFIFMFSGSSEATIRIEPARFIFPLEQGTRDTGTIKITNNSGVEKEIKAVLYDWTLDKKGKLVTLEKGKLKESLNGLIKFNPKQFTLKSGETQIVRFTVKMPEEGNIEHRGIVFFEEEQKYEPNSSGADVVTQVGATVYVRPTNIDLSLFKYKGIKIYYPENESSLGILIIENQCNSHMRYFIKYKIINSEGKQVLEGSTENKVILPEFTRGIAIPLKKDLESGEYNIILHTSFYGTENIMETTIPFELK